MNKINVYMDDNRTPCLNDSDGFPDIDNPDPHWVVTRTVQDTKALLSTGLVHDLALDHDLGPGEDGTNLINWMEETNTWPSGEITVHSRNTIGKERMLAVIARHKVASICSACQHNNLNTEEKNNV